MIVWSLLPHYNKLVFKFLLFFSVLFVRASTEILVLNNTTIIYEALERYLKSEAMIHAKYNTISTNLDLYCTKCTNRLDPIKASWENLTILYWSTLSVQCQSSAMMLLFIGYSCTLPLYFRYALLFFLIWFKTLKPLWHISRSRTAPECITDSSLTYYG